MSYVIEFCAFHDFIFYRKSLHYGMALIGLALLTLQRIRNVLFKLPWSTKFSSQHWSSAIPHRSLTIS